VSQPSHTVKAKAFTSAISQHLDYLCIFLSLFLELQFTLGFLSISLSPSSILSSFPFYLQQWIKRTMFWVSEKKMENTQNSINTKIVIRQISFACVGTLTNCHCQNHVPASLLTLWLWHGSCCYRLPLPLCQCKLSSLVACSLTIYSNSTLSQSAPSIYLYMSL